MKPLKLKLSAFGPFAGIEEIDFEKLGESGVYLIAGDTGAGKTIIFDALSFALFGHASGSARDVKSLRSDFVLNVNDMNNYNDNNVKIINEKCFVELDFLCNNLEYKIKREIKCDKDGAYKSTEINLILPDKNIISGSICNEKIAEIIGLDNKQFAQIIMIAQNDFLRFLHSKTAERAEILRKIFKTEKLQLFQENLKNRAKEAGLKYEADKRFLEAQGFDIYRRAEQFSQWEREILDSEKICGEINSQILNLERVLPAAEFLERAEINLKEAQESVKESAERYKKSQEELRIAERELENLPDLKLKSEKLERIKIDWEKAIQKSKSAAELDFHGKIIQEKNKKLELSQKEFENLQEIFLGREKYYNECEELFLRNQAGILAQNLKPGEACPVCGSVEHPKLANLSKIYNNSDDNLNSNEHNVNNTAHISESGVKIARESAAKARIKRDEKAKECSDLNTQINILSERFENDLNKLKINDENNEENVINENGDILEEILKKIKKLELNLKFKKEELESEILSLNQRFEMFSQKKSNAEKEFNSLGGLIKERETREKSCFDILIQARKSYEESLESLKNHENFGENNIYAREAGTEINNLREEKIILSSKILDLQKKKENLSNYLIKFEQNEKYYANIKQMSDCANDKLNFETYAQMAYFERVLCSANLRLKKMSGGRYILLRKDENAVYDKRKNIGLELEIFDNYTGKSRSAASLSGGESFLAALSLALGLSDIVQQNAGGIKLDAMFIDEGFGSLDSEALEQAVKVLNEMAENGRIIGIISHVPELRERIDKQIVVERNNYGSKIKL